MSLLTLLIIAIGFALYLCLIRWGLPLLKAPDLVMPFTILGFVVLVLFLAREFGVWSWLSSVRI